MPLDNGHLPQACAVPCRASGYLLNRGATHFVMLQVEERLRHQAEPACVAKGSDQVCPAILGVVYYEGDEAHASCLRRQQDGRSGEGSGEAAACPGDAR
jgi:hypothetical protein